MKKNKPCPESLRALTKQEVAAMWLWSDHYAKTGMGAIAFYKQLAAAQKSAVDHMLKEIKEPPDA